MTPIKIAIIGYGKIAQDQHVPAIRGNDRFELVAVCDINPAAAQAIGFPP